MPTAVFGFDTDFFREHHSTQNDAMAPVLIGPMQTGQKVHSSHGKGSKKNKNFNVIDRVRTCAGEPI